MVGKRFRQGLILLSGICFTVASQALQAFVVQVDELTLNLSLPRDWPSFHVADSEQIEPHLEFEDNEIWHTDRLQLHDKSTYPLNLVRLKADSTLRVRGWKVTKTAYFGQTKVASEWGIGLVIDKGTYYYGINNRGVSFLKKF